MKKLLFIIVSSLASLSVMMQSCKNDKENPSEVNIYPLYQKIFSYPSLPEDERLARVDSFSDAFVALSHIYNQDLTQDSLMLNFARRPSDVAFYSVVEQILPATRIDSVENVVAVGFEYLKNEFPGLKLPKMYGVITPHVRKIYVVDSVMLISFNHYLGAGFEGYNSWPEYRSSVARLSLMPYNVVESWMSIQKPYQSKNPNVLSRLIYGGVMTHLKLSSIPESNLADALSYDDRRVKWVSDNENQIWNKLIQDDLLFSTDQSIIDKLIFQRQNNTLLHPDAPGRSAIYIGYRIVESYLKKYPETKLSDMLNPEFYNNPEILQKSGYKGGK